MSRSNPTAGTAQRGGARQSDSARTYEPWRWTTWAALIAAVVVPWAALCLAGIADDRPWSRVVSPFGWRRAALVYVAASVPLSVITARWFVALHPQRSATSSAAWSAVLGLAVAGATWAFGGDIGQVFALFGPASSAVARTAWSIILVWPWCLCWAAQRPARILLYFGEWPAAWGAVLATAAATALPWLYMQETLGTQTIAAEKALDTQHLKQAWVELNRLAEARSTMPVASPIGRTSVEDALAWTSTEVELCIETANAASAVDADINAQIEIARCCARIERLPQAKSLLEAPAKTSLEAAVLLAAVEDDLGNHEACERICRAGQAKALAAADDPASVYQHVALTRTLVNSLRRRRKYQEAEAELLAAISAMPTSAGVLNYELAEHYRMGGRPIEAVDRYRAAVAATPELRGRAEAAVRSLTQETPSCLLRFDGVASP